MGRLHIRPGSIVRAGLSGHGTVSFNLDQLKAGLKLEASSRPEQGAARPEMTVPNPREPDRRERSSTPQRPGRESARPAIQCAGTQTATVELRARRQCLAAQLCSPRSQVIVGIGAPARSAPWMLEVLVMTLIRRPGGWPLANTERSGHRRKIISAPMTCRHPRQARKRRIPSQTRLAATKVVTAAPTPHARRDPSDGVARAGVTSIATASALWAVSV